MYAGKINGLIGESESGKTWIALLAVLQAIRGRRPVVYLDFEDTAPGIVQRLKDMGATHDDLAWLTYIGPDEGLHLVARAELEETLITGPHLIVLDGFNAAMTLLGLDLNSNTDATRFAQQLLKPLARTGACVIYVDHVPKNTEARGKGGIGAQAKRAMTTGCALTVEVTQPFGRNTPGKLKLNVDKDRPGHVRAEAVYAKWAGVAHITPTAAGVEVRIDPSQEVSGDGSKGGQRLTGFMQKISIHLANHPEGCSGAAIEKAVSGDDKYVRSALATLRAEGYVVDGDKRNGVHVHRLDKPYVEALDPALDLGGTLGDPRW
jgi:hypothetical protein